MDLLDLPESTSRDQAMPAAKQRAVGASPAEVKKYLETTMKATCSLKFAERIFRAVSTDTFVLDTTDEFVTESKATTQNFNKKAKELSAATRRKELGEPHAQVFNTWVRVAIKHHQERGNLVEVKRLQKYVSLLTAMGKEKALETIASQVRYAYVTHPRGANRKSRLEANVRETITQLDPAADPEQDDLGLKILPCPSYAAWLSIQMALNEKGAELKHGMPPPGDLERRVQNAINEMAGEPARYRMED